MYSQAVKIILTFIGILTLGTIGYRVLETDWTWFDAFYMTVISISTVGFGEIHTLSLNGRIFTVCLIFGGLGIAAAFAGQLAKLFVENQLKNIFRKGDKMQKQINLLKDHYVVCGFGRIGRIVCITLHEAGIPFVVIESNEELIKIAEHYGFYYVIGNATSDTVLTSAGIKRAAGVLACLYEDADNLFVSLAARELNPDIYIISRGSDTKNEKRLVRAGANSVVYPLKLGAEQIARIITGQNQATAASHPLVENAPSGIMGYSFRVYRHFTNNPITVSQIRLRASAESVLKIQRSSGDLIPHPDDSLLIEENDSVLLLVEKYSEEEYPKQNHTLGNVSIEWMDEFSVGIADIDEQHKQLFDYVNQFLQGIKKEHDPEIMKQLFNNLVEYTTTHFTKEENFFEKYSYPETAQHKEQHKVLTKKVLELNKNKDFVFEENVTEFLYSWLKDHILDMDTRFAVYLIQNKLSTD